MRLLVTRPEPDAGAQAEELRNLGHEPVLQPLLEFHVLDFDPAPIATADALIFTSRNALRALSEKLDPGGIPACPVYCVGSETERRLRQAGFQTIAAVAETAEELAGKIAGVVAKGAKSRPCNRRASGIRSRAGADAGWALRKHAVRLCDEGAECLR